jgi:hypothetical protein
MADRSSNEHIAIGYWQGKAMWAAVLLSLSSMVFVSGTVYERWNNDHSQFVTILAKIDMLTDGVNATKLDVALIKGLLGVQQGSIIYPNKYGNIDLMPHHK